MGSLLAPARYWSIFYLFLVTVPEVLTKYLVPVSISFLLKVVNGWPRETEEVATIIHDECNDQSQFRRTSPFQLQKIWKTSFCVELVAAGVGISKIVAICWCVFFYKVIMGLGCSYAEEQKIKFNIEVRPISVEDHNLFRL